MSSFWSTTTIYIKLYQFIPIYNILYHAIPFHTMLYQMYTIPINSILFVHLHFCAVAFLFNSIPIQIRLLYVQLCKRLYILSDITIFPCS